MSMKDLSAIKTIAIIQARIKSERLYEKSILPLCGIPMLVHIIQRAKTITGVSKVIVATGNEIDNKRIRDIANKHADVFFGDDYNVLSRYYLAAQKESPDFVIRITGDNPFTDTDLASKALSLCLQDDADLASISDIPTGCAVEIISFSALSSAYNNSKTDYQQEHVTPYIKEHPELFRIRRYSPPPDLYSPGIRLTVDTQQDYDLARIIYEKLYKDGHFSLSEVLKVISDNPSLLEINKSIEQRPMTHSQNRGSK